MTKKWLLGLCLLLSSFGAAAQKDIGKVRQEILDEAYELYYRESASWHATDILQAKHEDLFADLGGYLSYKDEGQYATIFWSKTNPDTIRLKLTFADPKDPTSATSEQDLKASPQEKDLIGLRIAAKEIVNANSDKFFKFYSGSSLNIIPIIDGKTRKVVILCGPSVNGVIIFGNDYEMSFDTKNKLIKKRKLHSSLIDLDINPPSGEKRENIAYHTHIKKHSPFITPTDICTLLLYAPYLDWRQHYVTSKKYVSIWDIEEQALIIMSSKAFKKIGKHMEKP